MDDLSPNQRGVVGQGGKTACVVFVIALLLMPVGCSWMHKKQGKEFDFCRKRIEQSFQAQQTGDYEQAREHLKEAVAARPEHAESWWNLAELSIQQDQHAHAVRELKRYLELQPDDPQAYLRLAQLYYLQNQFTLSQETLQYVIKRSPNQFEAVMLAARLARKQANHQQAISAYYHALQILPHHPDATLELGELLISRYEPDRAAMLLRELERKSLSEPDRARTHLNLGIAYGQIERWDEAVQHLEASQELAQDVLPRDRYRLAFAHWKAGSSQQSLKLLLELADSGHWDKRTEMLYATVTDTRQNIGLQEPSISLAQHEWQTAQAPPFPDRLTPEPFALPARLIPAAAFDPQELIPPEWQLPGE